MVVNLDPGNDLLPYDCAVDIMDLVKLEEVMDELELGPNGGLVYCMEYIEQNLDWLQEKLATECKDKYILFDLPGKYFESRVFVSACVHQKDVIDAYACVRVCVSVTRLCVRVCATW